MADSVLVVADHGSVPATVKAVMDALVRKSSHQTMDWCTLAIEVLTLKGGDLAVSGHVKPEPAPAQTESAGPYL